jgi:hypothetical protein
VVKVAPNYNTLPAFNGYFYYLNQSMRKKWKFLLRGVFDSIYGKSKKETAGDIRESCGIP